MIAGYASAGQRLGERYDDVHSWDRCIDLDLKGHTFSRHVVACFFVVNVGKYTPNKQTGEAVT